jgi:hypothetical protein
MKKIILVLAVLFFMGFSGYGQARPCPQGAVPCGPDHTCLPRNECRGGPNPPPPGLVVPIDNHLSLLLAAGLCFGVYFFVSKGNKSATVN